MAGIEEAFEKFVTRVSSREKSPAEESLSKYKSYSEQELLGNLSAKYPNYELKEENMLYNMPMYEPMDVLPPRSMPVMPQIMNRDREYMDLADGGRVGYAFGGMLKQAVSQIGDQLAEKLPPEQQEAIVKLNLNEGGIGGIFKNIISRVKDVVSKVVKNQPTATPAAGLAIPLNRPLQPGDPIGSYYADPNNPPLSIASSTNVVPPATNSLTRPLGIAGFYGSEISEILKRLGFNFAEGGSVETGLTTTVPPAKGPDSQGVESLFRRRYS
jgi:hypothetical protein